MHTTRAKRIFVSRRCFMAGTKSQLNFLLSYWPKEIRRNAAGPFELPSGERADYRMAAAMSCCRYSCCQSPPTIWCCIWLPAIMGDADHLPPLYRTWAAIYNTTAGRYGPRIVAIGRRTLSAAVYRTDSGD